jgi:hypothetical protein
MSSVRIVVIVPELLNCRHASPETQAFGQIILHPFGHGMPAHSIKVCMDCFMRFSGLSLRNVENRGNRHVN